MKNMNPLMIVSVTLKAICMSFLYVLSLVGIVSLITSKDTTNIAPIIICLVLTGCLLISIIRTNKKLVENNASAQVLQELTKKQQSHLPQPTHKVSESKRYKAGLMDIFKAKENRNLKCTIVQLQANIAELSTPEYQNVDYLRQKENNIQSQVNQLLTQINTLNYDITTRQVQIIQLDEEILLQDFGLYKPLYNFANSTQYKDALTNVRAQQKLMIKNKMAATCITEWVVNNNRTQGKKMTNDSIKQIILTFNIECENTIDRVTFSNFRSMTDRIHRAYDKLNTLNAVHTISISNQYLKLKLQELNLAYEYQCKKQEEKEELRELREIQRENAKVEKELAEERQHIQKEQQHYNNVIQRLLEQIEAELNEERLTSLLEKKVEIEASIIELDNALKDIDYREANQRAGYVYIISNLGSFGENVYKIGMTRRLEPLDRVNELGDASVPFKFDVHALIFSNDAPKLESALHNAFADKRLNAINNRKEFFKVSLKEIEDVVKSNHDKTVDFTSTMPAEQYRETLILHKR